MKKTLIFFFFFILFTVNLFSFDIQASTTYNGVVSLKEDGTWEWIIQPEEFTGMNDNESQPLPDSGPETVPFDFNRFASYPVDYIGSWTWISGQVISSTGEDEGVTVRLKTPKKTDGWIKEYGDVLIIQYSGRELTTGESIEILVQFKQVGYKYYSNVPVFLYTDSSRLRTIE
ncbi:MAG TPA: hypothetical protein PLB99_11755 [Thermotogota bacterium]|nr:hypothetical protein [Thermotogota bacterium]